MDDQQQPSESKTPPRHRGLVWSPRSLSDAIKEGDTEKVADFLDAYPELLEWRDETLSSCPLHTASGSNRVEVVRLLLNRGAEIAPRDHQGLTPLHWAAQNAAVEAAGELLYRGANPDTRDFDGWSPLVFAMRDYGWDERCVRLADLLLRHGATLGVYCALEMGRGDEARRLLADDPETLSKSPCAELILWAYKRFVQSRADAEAGPLGSWEIGAVQAGEKAEWLDAAQRAVSRELDLLDALLAQGVYARSTRYDRASLLGYLIKLPHPSVAERILASWPDSVRDFDRNEREQLHEAAAESPFREAMRSLLQNHQLVTP